MWNKFPQATWLPLATRAFCPNFHKHKVKLSAPAIVYVSRTKDAGVTRGRDECDSRPCCLLHICAGTLGCLSGALAVSFRKGSQRHRMAGNIFVLSMLSLGASGAYLAFLKSQPGNVLGGTLTFYLVATAWMTARRRDGETDLFRLGRSPGCVGDRSCHGNFWLRSR